MAGEAVVGALRVVLGMDTGSYEDGAKKAAKRTEEFGDAVKAVFGGVTLSRIVERTFDAITHAIREGITHAFEFADQMGKTAQKVGVSVQELSGLKVAADLSDVSMESLSTSLGKLAKAMTDAGKGSEEQQKHFDALGINVRNADGSLRSITDVFVDIADKFHGAEDGATKTAAALNLLGKGGKDLIPLLNEGGKSIREWADAAQRMGLIVTKDASAQAQQFNDNLKILHLSFQGLVNQVVAQLLPGLVNLTNQFADVAKEGTQARITADAIVKTFKEFVLTAGEVVVVVGFIKDAFKNFTDTQDKIKDGTAGIDEQKGAVTRLWEQLKALDQITSQKMWDTKGNFEEPTAAVADLNRRLQDMRNLILDAFRIPPTVDVKPVKQLNEETSKLQEELNRLAVQARVLGGDFSSLPAGFAELAVRLDLTDKKAASLGFTFDQLTPKQKQFAAAMDLITAKQVAFEAISPFEKYQLAMDNLVRLEPIFQKLGLDQDALTQKFVAAGAAMVNAYATMAQSITQPVAQAFRDLASMNKQFATAAKAAAIGEAIVNTAVAVTKALGSLPYPFSIAAAAAVAAAGAVQVAKISQTNFATGGSFKVGGAGGIDSQLVTFNATPGEMVDVRKPGQDRGTATEVTVNLRGRELLNKDMVRDLFSALNDGVRDGYRLKLAET